MILIITHKQDFTADFVIDKLNERGIKYYRLNCEDIQSISYSFHGKSAITLTIEGAEQFRSVWFRRTKLPEIDIEDEAQKLFVLSDYDSLFDNIFTSLDAQRWLSHPKHVYEAENKLYQLKVASALGFIIPATIVTQSKEELKEFISQFNGEVIIKPIRQGRVQSKSGFKTVFTNKVPHSIYADLDDFDLTPCIVQEYIEKEYELRITVVDGKVFAAKVDSQNLDDTSVDWRRMKVPFEPYQLPKSFEKKCVELLNKMQLSFGAIDVIKSKQNEYVFVEINPNGQWAWIEMETKMPISEAIINFLTTQQ